MHLNDFNVDDAAARCAGFAGAVLTAYHLKGSWLQKIFMVFAGGLVSIYMGPFVGLLTGMRETAAGFLVGMFGMAIAAKALELIQSSPAADIWVVVLDWIRRRLGVSK